MSQIYIDSTNNRVATGYLRLAEIAAPTGASAVSLLYHDSADDALKVKVNGDTAQIPVLSTSSGSAISPILTNLSLSGTFNYYKKPVVSQTTTPLSLAATQSGSIVILKKADGIAINLPTPAAGLFFEFFVGTAPTSTGYVITSTSDGSSAANIMFGVTASAEDAAGASASSNSAVDVFTFVANKAVIGDSARMISDGTNWYASGFCTVQDAFTIA